MVRSLEGDVDRSAGDTIVLVRVGGVVHASAADETEDDCLSPPDVTLARASLREVAVLQVDSGRTARLLAGIATAFAVFVAFVKSHDGPDYLTGSR